jgi:hypothetical protein
MSEAANIVDLRRMLRERFPAAHQPRREGAGSVFPTGIRDLDHLLGGGLPAGSLAELVGEGNGSGSAQVLHALLGRTAADGRFLALVDGADSFDVDAPEPAALARLLWVRCRTAEEALKATDMLLRDRNFPLVVLDLKLNPARQLRRIASSVWHRLGRIAEHNGTTLLIITPFPMVGASAFRVSARSGLGLAAVSKTALAVAGELEFTLLRSHEQGGVVSPRAGAA